MSRYDYGLRGPEDTMPPRFADVPRPGHDDDVDPPPRLLYGMDNVTDSYNVDYVRPLGERYSVNPYPYGGDSNDRMRSEADYSPPYLTRAGTRTFRGTRTDGYADPDYAPFYSRRYLEGI